MTCLATFWSWLVDNSNAIIALLTVILALWGFIQIWQTRGAHRRELRAYIHIKETQVVGHDILNTLLGQKTGPNPPDDFFYKVVFQNMGQTPAYDVECISDVRLFKVKLDKGTILPLPDTESMESWISKTSMGPNAINVKRTVIPRALTQEERAKLASKSFGIYLYGTIFYKDAFKYQRRTNFRYKHFIWAHESKFGDQLAVCPEGNEAN